MTNDLTPDSLPVAIAGLFRLNGYDVSGPLMKYGGEIDLVAEKRGDLFADPIYIEATVEHVGNDKYSKDMTKLLAVQRQEPGAKLLIVSSTGFTAPVRAKARDSGVTTFTFAELEREFQRFEPYIEMQFGDSGEATALAQLEEVYVEPLFDDSMGSDPATDWLTSWLTQPEGNRWLIITGEYGTGKTALTRVLLRRWLAAYRTDATLPIPIRIELRAFTRQFDARTLLHHFLDTNALGHLPLDFVLSLIRAGRVVLLLDGYDEMAQYMTARERRACLEALAQLSADGARGILTSRPNYFTEAEELQVLDALYSSFEQMGMLTSDEESVVASEAEVDSLFEQQFIERVERQLRDLTPQQTQDLVSRKLAEDPDACAVVLGLLQRIFRSDGEGAEVALSGKPVIITYLLEIADDLKLDAPGEDKVTEWQIYDLIVRKLMVRDYRAAPEILPERRRGFLGRLALRLSKKGTSVMEDDDFTAFVKADFDPDLRQVPIEVREERLQQYVTDLRRSATLTRASVGGASGSRFSHNSLREFLAVEALLAQLARGRAERFDIPISPAMRNFVATQSEDLVSGHIERLAVLWPERVPDDGAGQLLSLVWSALLTNQASAQDPVRDALAAIVGPQLDLGRSSIDGLDASAASPAELRGANFRGSTVTRASFAGADLSGAKFIDAVLDEVDFSACDLTAADFARAALADVDITGATIKNADFAHVDDQFAVVDGGDRYEGAAALGLLRARGALTADVDPIHSLRHHAKFDVAIKVARVLLDGGTHQVRGLTQRGTARSDPKFARRLLVLLLNQGFLVTSRSNQLVQITDEGRKHLQPFADLTRLTPVMKEIFERAL